MKNFLKGLIFVTLAGWGLWTGVTIGICYFFRTDFAVTYLVVGVIYGVLLLVAISLYIISKQKE